MEILVKVDQKAAFAAGIDAPSSTAKIALDPAILSQEEREIICRLSDGSGFDLSKKLHHQEPLCAFSPLKVLRPQVDDLRAVLASAIAAEKGFREKENAAFRQVFQSIIKAGVTTSNGRPKKPFLQARYEYPDGGGMFMMEASATMEALDQSMQDAWAALMDEYEKADAAFTAADLAEKREKEEKAQVAKKVAEAEREAIYSRLPPLLRQRAEAGYASEKEIHRAMRRVILADEGVVDARTSWGDTSRLYTLTDEQFVALSKHQADWQSRSDRFGDISILPYSVWDVSYRAATDDDDPEDVDDDGEVCERSNEAVVAIVSVEKAGARFRFALPLM